MTDIRKIGIIGAMSEEVVSLTKMLEDRRETSIAGLTFHEGTIDGKELVVVECGIAKVNAAMTTQILISEFKVDAVINTGVAGALHQGIRVNDVVISTEAIEYDVDASFMGDPKGTIPRMKTSVFLADKRLVEAAYRAFEEGHARTNVYKGRIVTGDKFVADKDTKVELRDHFKGYCCEMEGGAIAHVAHLNKIPFVIIRAISDNADDEAGVSYEEFVVEAAEISREMVVNIIERL